MEQYIIYIICNYVAVIFNGTFAFLVLQVT